MAGIPENFAELEFLRGVKPSITVPITAPLPGGFDPAAFALAEFNRGVRPQLVAPINGSGSVSPLAIGQALQAADNSTLDTIKSLLGIPNP